MTAAELLRWLCVCAFALATTVAVGTGKDSRQLLIDILSEAAIGSTSCEHVRRSCHGIDLGTIHDSVGIAEIAALKPEHFERDLHNWASKQSWRKLLPTIYEFDLEVLTTDGLDVMTVKHHCLLPHEFFHRVSEAGKDLFEHIFGTREQLIRWWADAENESCDWYVKHPIIPTVGPELRVPLGMHGDDGGMHGQEPVLVLSWNSVVNFKPSDWSRLLFTMVRVSSIAPNTMHTVYGMLAWSFNALAAGTFPDADYTGRKFSRLYDPKRFFLAGKPLAEGARGVWSEMRGDWKYLKESLKLSHHYGTRPRICHLCHAGKTSMLYTNVDSTNADHRQTCVSHEDWWNRYSVVAGACPLLFILGFHIWRCFFDIMHTLYLGVYQHVLPSCLWELTNDTAVWNHSDKTNRLFEAYGKYRGWCKVNKLKSITKKRFTSKRLRPSAKKYPLMSQVTAKAAATRSMAYWVESLCRPRTGTRHDKVRAAMMHSFVQADIVCRKAGRQFSNEEQVQ